MELSARRGLGCGQRVGWRNVVPLDDEARSRKRAIHELAFAVNCRIDLVSHAIVALVPLESDIVRRCNAPQRPPVDLVR